MHKPTLLRNHYKPYLIFLLSILTIIAVIPAVSASDIPSIPGIPHSFYGNVTINGAPVPDGTLVAADVDMGTIISGIEVHNPVETVNGKFGIGEEVPRLVVQGEIPQGATVMFTVNGIDTGRTVLYQPGKSTAINLDIWFVRGDLNGNRYIDIGDVSKVAYMVAELTPVDMAADFNGNDIVDTGDAAMIAYAHIGKIPAL